MAETKEYDVDLGWTKTTMLLSDEDAAKYGERAVPVKKAAAPANKARKTASDK